MIIINISNLGVVKNAQIHLKPLTVFVGENSTGKTWTAYTIACLLGHYGYKKYLESYLNGETEFKFQILEDSIQTLLNKGNATINVKDFVENYAERFINEIANLVPQWLDVFMATKRVNFSETSISVKFTPKFMKKMIEKSITSKVIAGAKLSIGKEDSSLLSLKALKERNTKELYYYVKSENKDVGIPKAIKDKEIREFCITTLFQVVHNTIVSNTPIFPTERTSPITISRRENNFITRKDRKNKDLEDSIPEPARYFLAMLSSSMRRFFERKKEKLEDSAVNNFIKLSDFLENELLRGKVDFEDQSGSVELLYNPKKGTNLELHISSSMVKELAPLSLYLKYLANANDLVIIDEPEMNLHPAAQAEIIEFIGMLVNSELNILITTHSPYIVDHLVNLILASKHENKNEIKNNFFLEQENAFVSQDDVSVYLFDNGTAKNIISEDGEIDWDTFSDVSREVSRIYSRLL